MAITREEQVWLQGYVAGVVQSLEGDRWIPMEFKNLPPMAGEPTEEDLQRVVVSMAHSLHYGYSFSDHRILILADSAYAGEEIKLQPRSHKQNSNLEAIDAWRRIIDERN